MPSVNPVKEYRARIDSKMRLTLQSSGARDFKVLHRKDGSILLKPVAGDGAKIPARLLKSMDLAMENLRRGKRSKPANLAKYARHFK
jgi:hypothetical protein